jgi:hypothetical protein
MNPHLQLAERIAVLGLWRLQHPQAIRGAGGCRAAYSLG